MPDDKWTAQRGPRGEWRWKGEPPAAPGATPDAGQTLFPDKPQKRRRRPPSLGLGGAVTRLAAIPAAAGALASAAAGTLTRPARQLWARATTRPARTEPRDFTIFALVLSLFTFAASLTLLAVLLASITIDNSPDGAGPPGEEPTPPPGETPPLIRTATPTTSATPGRTPTVTPRRTPAATPGVLVPPGPEGDVSLALWANQIDAWWFGSPSMGSAVYHPGDEVPWLARWEAEPGSRYQVTITYDCRAGDIPLIDLLTGVEHAHDAIFLARWGPGSTHPEAAVPVPDTPDSEIDDGAPGLLYIYGGQFKLLPEGPSPAGPCVNRRSITMPVEATSGAVILMGSAWLAHPDDHQGTGAADARTPIRLRIAVSGLGEDSAALPTPVVSPA